MTSSFAPQSDMSEKAISFTEVGGGLWAFTAKRDTNSGVIIGDDSVMIVEAQAMPRLAGKVIEKVRGVTEKPICHVVLTHYHAVRGSAPRPSAPRRSSCPTPLASMTRPAASTRRGFGPPNAIWRCGMPYKPDEQIHSAARQCGTPNWPAGRGRRNGPIANISTGSLAVAHGRLWMAKDLRRNKNPEKIQ